MDHVEIHITPAALTDKPWNFNGFNSINAYLFSFISRSNVGVPHSSWPFKDPGCFLLVVLGPSVFRQRRREGPHARQILKSLPGQGSDVITDAQGPVARTQSHAHT